MGRGNADSCQKVDITLGSVISVGASTEKSSKLSVPVWSQNLGKDLQGPVPNPACSPQANCQQLYDVRSESFLKQSKLGSNNSIAYLCKPRASLNS